MALMQMKDFPYQYGIRMRFYPSDEGRHIVAVNAGASRFIYNRMVAVGREIHELEKVTIYCEPVAKRLDFLRSSFGNVKQMSNLAPFLNDKYVDAQAKANAVQNYRRAWENFRKVPGTSIPTFHRKSYEQSYQTNPHYYKNGGCNVRFTDMTHVMLPILGKVRVKGSYDIMGGILPRMKNPDDPAFIRIGTITVSMDACGDYFLSMQLGSCMPFVCRKPSTGKKIGIDVNVDNYYTDSNGRVVENDRFRRNHQQDLAEAQRRMARRAQAARKADKPLYLAKNYQKSRLEVARIHRQIARQREDRADRESMRLIENQDLVVSEDLKVRNLLKNHCLAGSISDVAWSTLFEKLAWKASLYGKVYIKVPPHYTTQTCSSCGYVLLKDSHLTLNDREWTCPRCGTHHNRDHNSAIVIRDRGLDNLRS